MTSDPTESIDNEITVIVFDSPGRDRITCHSYEEAIKTVREKQKPGRVTKIEGRDEEIVFTSDEMNIDDWENEWKIAKRRQGVDVEEHECPYTNAGCVADDLCVQCKMDKLQREY